MDDHSLCGSRYNYHTRASLWSVLFYRDQTSVTDYVFALLFCIVFINFKRLTAAGQNVELNVFFFY